MYNEIIESSKNRTLPESTYTERHHIIPRCMGGTDDKDNIAVLTGREHFIGHWLLTKCTEGEDHGKMIHALSMMRSQTSSQDRYNTKITARVFENIRKEYGQRISKQNTGRRMRR